MIHDGWSPYDRFLVAHHQQCLQHLPRRSDNMAAAATRGAVCFLRWVAELLRAGLDLRDRHAAGQISTHGLAVARGRLENRLANLLFPTKMNAANERLAQHLWAHRNDLFTFSRQPGLGATDWRAELAIRFGVILRKVWGGSRTWPGARAQSVLMSVWRTCWQQGGSALDFLSQLLRGTPRALALPPVTYRANSRSVNRPLGYRLPAGSTRQSITGPLTWCWPLPRPPCPWRWSTSPSRRRWACCPRARASWADRCT
jgi:transposase